MRQTRTHTGVVAGQPWLFALLLCASLVPTLSVRADSRRPAVYPGESSEIGSLAHELSAQHLAPASVLHSLLTRVRALQAQRPGDALRGYLDIVEYVEAVKSQPLLPQQVYQWVVLPGIELGERLRAGELNPGQKRALARLYFAKGQHLCRSPNISREIAEDGYRAFQQALTLDDDPRAAHRTECLYRRDIALMYLGRLNLEQFEADARAGTKLDPGHPGPHFLLGYVFYARQRATEAALPRFKLLRDAAEEFTRAIDLLGEREDVCKELAIYYEYRVNAWIKLSEFYTDERTRYLQNAADDAQEAVQRGPTNLANAYSMLGTALEVLAGTSDPERLAQALTAFRGAAAASPRAARHWIALGRCECKLAALAPEVAATHATAALDHLRRALPAAGGQPLTEAERAELHYWRGQAYLLDPRQDALAEQAFAEAVAVTGPKTEAWVSLALEHSALLALHQAEKIGDPANPQLKTYLQRARARADALTAFKHRHRVVARIRGKAFELENKPVEALAQYDAELAREEKAQEITDRQLALIRLDLMFNEKWRATLQQKRKVNASLTEPAKAPVGGS